MTNQIPLDVVIGRDEDAEASVKKIHPEAIWIRADSLDTARKCKWCTSACITHDLDEEAPDEVEFVPAGVYTKTLDEAKLKITNLVQHIKELEQTLEASRLHRTELEERLRAVRAHYMEFSRLIRTP